MNRIAIVRRSRGMSQEQLGEKIGLGQTALSKIENEQVAVSLENLREIAKALRASVCELIEEPPFSDEVMAIAAKLEAMSGDTRAKMLPMIDRFGKLPEGELDRLSAIATALGAVGQQTK